MHRFDLGRRVWMGAAVVALVSAVTAGCGEKAPELGDASSAAAVAPSSSTTPAPTTTAAPTTTKARPTTTRRATTTTRRPTTTTHRAAPTTAPPTRNCDPAYPDRCLHDGIGDYDCAGGSGNGPNYVTGPIRVRPPDPFGLDADGDGVGCEKS
jgi:hypothetical protein